MSISIAEYLIHQAVRTASGLQQQTKDNNNQSTVKFQKEKASHRTDEVKRIPSSTSAYRVTISPAALKKMASSDIIG